MYRSIAGLLSVVLLLAGPAATAQSSKSSPVPATPATPAVAAVLAAKPAATTTAVTGAKPRRINITVGELNGDCTARAPNLIHDSRSPGGCAPCSRGRVPNAARRACVIPIPHSYRP